jgi:hypothetical protein
MKWFALALLLLVPQDAKAEPCTLQSGGSVMEPAGESRVRVALQTEPAPITVGSPFQVMLSVCSEDGEPVERLTIDATMPAHRHGMNYKPEVRAGADGRYEARGFLFHMPGAWQFAVTVHSKGQPSRFKLDVNVR